MLFWIALFGRALEQFSRFRKPKSILVAKSPSTQMHLIYLTWFDNPFGSKSSVHWIESGFVAYSENHKKSLSFRSVDLSVN